MEEDLRAILFATSSLTDLVGDRIDWGSSPQSVARPNVVMHLVGGAQDLTMKGPDGLFSGRVQIDCFANSFDAAKLSARAVEDVLSGYRNGAFRAVIHLATRDGREGGSNEADRPYRSSLDFNVNWRAE